MTSPDFCLEVPAADSLQRVTRFGGWWLEWAAKPGASMSLAIDGVPIAALQRVQRPDVGHALPEAPRAAAAGFVGDLVLPSEYEDGTRLTVTVCATDAAGDVRVLHERAYTVAGPHRVPALRTRAFDLNGLLAHPAGGPLRFHEFGMPSLGGDTAATVIAGIPHFHPPGELPLLRLLDTQPTHRLGAYVERLLGDTDGVALDFGAGVPGPDRLRANVVNFDLIQFPNIDVCSSYPRLPFRDAAFALVFSLATFEHLPDPRAAALEVARILAPGGLFFVDTAFMQPLHGDPDHYFNMTTSGLRRILEGFDIVDIGTKINHTPSKSLAMQIDAVLPLMREGSWSVRLQALVSELRERGAELDEDLGDIGRETLAAGTYALARRR
jgi:SAM-dependent methyltransferase